MISTLGFTLTLNKSIDEVCEELNVKLTEEERLLVLQQISGTTSLLDLKENIKNLVTLVVKS
jgi:hypothetical protein